MSNGNYILGMKEPSSGDKVHKEESIKMRNTPSSSKEEWHGRG